MQAGVPLDVKRGYCLVDTTFKQNGQLLNRDDVMRRLSKNQKSRPYVAQGNTLAIGSVVATILATPAIIVGASAKGGDIHMSDGASTGLLVGGIVAGVASWALCIASDGKYVTAAETYNEQFTKPPDQDGDRADEY
jgi:hypothetical protein